MFLAWVSNCPFSDVSPKKRKKEKKRKYKETERSKRGKKEGKGTSVMKIGSIILPPS